MTPEELAEEAVYEFFLRGNLEDFVEEVTYINGEVDVEMENALMDEVYGIARKLVNEARKNIYFE
ncbi:hypothetical protein [Mycobacteroides abscessus]